MNVTEYFAYRQTDHWREMRRLALEHAEQRCQLCNATETLEVHHRTYERVGSERLSDLTVLCAGCHEWHHGRGKDRRHTRSRGEHTGEPSLIVPIARYDALKMAVEGLAAVLDYGMSEDIRGELRGVVEDVDATPGVLPYRASAN